MIAFQRSFRAARSGKSALRPPINGSDAFPSAHLPLRYFCRRRWPFGRLPPMGVAFSRPGLTICRHVPSPVLARSLALLGRRLLPSSFPYCSLGHLGWRLRPFRQGLRFTRAPWYVLSRGKCNSPRVSGRLRAWPSTLLCLMGRKFLRHRMQSTLASQA